MPASNTVECFEHFIGRRVEGVLVEPENKILVFDNGEGLNFHTPHGTWWIVSKRDVERKIDKHRDQLERTQKRLIGVLKLAGVEP